MCTDMMTLSCNLTISDLPIKFSVLKARCCWLTGNRRGNIRSSLCLNGVVIATSSLVGNVCYAVSFSLEMRHWTLGRLSTIVWIVRTVSPQWAYRKAVAVSAQSAQCHFVCCIHQVAHVRNAKFLSWLARRLSDD